MARVTERDFPIALGSVRWVLESRLDALMTESLHWKALDKEVK